MEKDKVSFLDGGEEDDKFYISSTIIEEFLRDKKEVTYSNENVEIP